MLASVPQPSFLNLSLQDLSLAWAGRLPVPGVASATHKPKRATLSADLIDLWNASFFVSRGIEAVLYKGRERRSGPHVGIADLPMYLYNDDGAVDSDSTSSSSSDSEVSGSERYEPAQSGYGGMYGRSGYNQEVMDARRRRTEMKAEKRKRRKEKKIRRKEKARAKNYSLVLTCIPVGGVNQGGAAGTMSPGAIPPMGGPGMMPGGGPMMPGGHAGNLGGIGSMGGIGQY